MLSLKLLVVEDDIASLELMTEVLRSLEAEVRPYSDSKEAAVLLHREKFDGIFLDLEMQNLNRLALGAGSAHVHVEQINAYRHCYWTR